MAGAKKILVSKPELEGAAKNKLRFHKRWWDEMVLNTFEWNGTEGPFGKSFDVLGDGSLTMIWIPGHSEGLCALKVKGADGRYILLCADGAYSPKNWEKMILPGICQNRANQKKSLEWIRDTSKDPNCLGIYATHDSGVPPQVISL